MIVVLFNPDLSNAKEATQNIVLLQDTYVAAGNDNDSFSGEEGLYVGYRRRNAQGRQRSLLKFSIDDNQLRNSHPDSNITVTSATLKLHMWNASDDNDELKLRIERMLVDWEPTITWNQLVSIPLPTEPDVEFGVRWVDLGEISVNIAPILQSWMDDREFNTPLSLLLSSEDGENTERFRAFVAKDCARDICSNLAPSLAFTYQIVPPTPTPIPPTPTPPIALQVNTEVRPSPATTDTNQVYVDDEIDVALITSNIPSTTTTPILISTFPSGFELVPDSASDNPIIDVTASLTQTQTITWSTPWMNSDLSIDTINIVTQTYTIRRATINQSFQPNKPPTQSRPKTNITFELKDPPSEDGYCYKWDFGDGDDSVFQLKDKRKIEYVYENSDESPFTVSVTITEPKDANSSSGIPQFFRAAVTTEIEIKGRSGQTSAQTYKSDCGIQEGIQDIVITVQLQNDLSEPVSASALIAPSKHTYMPIICYPCGDEE